MQKKYTLYIGLNDKDAGRQLLETSEAVARVLDICGDCTYSVKSGVWTDDNGETVVMVTADWRGVQGRWRRR